MTGRILFAGVEHLLERIKRWSHQQIIITVTTNSHVITVYPTSRSSLFQKLEEPRTIAAIKNGTEDHTLLTTIGYGKMIRELVVPPHIDALEDVHEEEEPDKDAGEVSVDELDKDHGPFDKIEGLGHVHHAAEDVTTILDEVVDGLNDNPRAHEGGALCLVGELEVVEAEGDTKQKNNDPVDDL